MKTRNRKWLRRFAVAYSKVRSPNETMLIAQNAMRSALSAASTGGTFHIAS